MKKLVRSVIFAIIFGSTSAAIFAQNYKIKQGTSMSGNKMESTVYVKGSRKRTENGGMMGMGVDVATIEQCDLKRTVQVNDKKRTYYVQQDAVTESDIAGSTQTKAPVSAGKPTKGGTVTMTSNITDTGERKQMFGLTARHIKTSMTMVASPDACSKQDMRIDTDGWYVDLPLFSCPFNPTRNPMPHAAPRSGGCEDKYVTRQTGTGRLGFALEQTQTITTAGQDVAFTTSLETIEFSKATLDDALFEVPSNYKQATSSQELYGMPDMAAIIKGAGDQNNEEERPSIPSGASASTPSKSATPLSKRPGVKRIGVLFPVNRTNESVNIANLLSYLVQQLTVGTVEAVPISTEADAKREDCDYILSTDISKLKQSTASKVGGIFGKVTNIDPNAPKSYETQVDFKLTALASGQSILQNKSAGKMTGNADTASQGVLLQEASAVLAAVK